MLAKPGAFPNLWIDWHCCIAASDAYGGASEMAGGARENGQNGQGTSGDLAGGCQSDSIDLPCKVAGNGATDL
jgi:hypothetical protein